MHLHIDTNTHTQADINIYARHILVLYISIYIYIDIHLFLFECTHNYIKQCMYICIYVSVYTHAHVHLCAHEWIRNYKHTVFFLFLIGGFSKMIFTLMAHIYNYIYVYVYVYVYVYACFYMHAFMLRGYYHTFTKYGRWICTRSNLLVGLNGTWTLLVVGFCSFVFWVFDWLDRNAFQTCNRHCLWCNFLIYSLL